MLPVNERFTRVRYVDLVHSTLPGADEYLAEWTALLETALEFFPPETRAQKRIALEQMSYLTLVDWLEERARCGRIKG